MVRKQLFSFCQQYKECCWPASRAVLSKERNYRKEGMTYMQITACSLKFIFHVNVLEGSSSITEKMSACSNCAQLPHLEYPYWSVTTLAPLQEGYFLKTWCSWKSFISEAKSPTNTENSGLQKAQLCSGKQAHLHPFK